MGLGTVLDDFVEEKMLNLNTCFIGKVESVKAGKAKVQPLTMFKTYGGEAKQPAIVEDVPICKNVYKIELYEWEQMPPEGDHPPHKHEGHVRLVPVQAGDIVVCVCADRDISETQNGSMALPSLGHHDISNAIIVGLLSDW